MGNLRKLLMSLCFLPNDLSLDFQFVEVLLEVSYFEPLLLKLYHEECLKHFYGGKTLQNVAFKDFHKHVLSIKRSMITTFGSQGG